MWLLSIAWDGSCKHCVTGRRHSSKLGGFARSVRTLVTLFEWTLVYVWDSPCRLSPCCPFLEGLHDSCITSIQVLYEYDQTCFGAFWVTLPDGPTLQHLLYSFPGIVLYR